MVAKAKSAPEISHEETLSRLTRARTEITRLTGRVPQKVMDGAHHLAVNWKADAHKAFTLASRLSPPPAEKHRIGVSCATSV